MQDADEQGDEHHRIVPGGQGLVERTDDAVGARLRRAQGPELGGSGGHDQRGGHALAGNVPDAEIEGVITDEEIVEVAAHGLGRQQLAQDVDIAAVRESGVFLGQHGHLDLAGDAQFALHRHPLFGGGCQLPDIVRQRMLHVVERVPQPADLVVVLDLGERGIEIALRHLFRRAGQLLQRPGRGTDGTAAEEEGQGEAAGQQEEDELTQDQSGIKHAPDRYDDTHGPGRGKGGIIDIGLDAVHQRDLLPALAGEHFPADQFIGSGILRAGVIEIVLIQDAGRIGMRQVIAGPAEDEAVRRPLLVNGRFFKAEITGAQAEPLQLLGQPCQRHVGTEHAHDPASGIFDRQHVGTEHLPGPGLIEIRIGPISMLRLKAFQIPFRLQVIMTL